MPNKYPVVIDGKTFTLTEAEREGRKTKKNPTPPAVVWLEPDLEAAEDGTTLVGQFVTSILNEAETQHKGAAKLFYKIFGEFLEDAADRIIDANGEVHVAKILPALIEVGRAAGLTEKDIVAQQAAMATTMAELWPLVEARATDPATFEKLLAEKGFTPESLTQEVLRVRNRSLELQELKNDIDLKKAERAAARAKKKSETPAAEAV